MTNDPRAALKQLIERNPGIELGHLRELFWLQVKGDKDLQFAMVDDMIRQVMERSFKTSSELPNSEVH